MRNKDFALDAALLGQNQRAWLAFGSDYIAPHMAVDTQAAAETDVAFDRSSGTYQAIDTILGFIAFLGSKHDALLFTTRWRFGSV
jgi:hypothetical protein